MTTVRRHAAEEAAAMEEEEEEAVVEVMVETLRIEEVRIFNSISSASFFFSLFLLICFRVRVRACFLIFLFQAVADMEAVNAEAADMEVVIRVEIGAVVEAAVVEEVAVAVAVAEKAIGTALTLGQFLSLSFFILSHLTLCIYLPRFCNDRICEN